jgi:hypothetical protein
MRARSRVARASPPRTSKYRQVIAAACDTSNHASTRAPFLVVSTFGLSAINRAVARPPRHPPTPMRQTIQKRSRHRNTADPPTPLASLCHQNLPLNRKRAPVSLPPQDAVSIGVCVLSHIAPATTISRPLFHRCAPSRNRRLPLPHPFDTSSPHHTPTCVHRHQRAVGDLHHMVDPNGTRATGRGGEDRG